MKLLSCALDIHILFLIPNALYIDLRKSDNEIQKILMLLKQAHWLITTKNIHFILSGSSARKLRHSGVNLLGGKSYTKTLI